MWPTWPWDRIGACFEAAGLAGMRIGGRADDEPIKGSKAEVEPDGCLLVDDGRREHALLIEVDCHTEA